MYFKGILCNYGIAVRSRTLIARVLHLAKNRMTNMEDNILVLC